jgi:transcriptional regulator with XRE-family HTH domain
VGYKVKTSEELVSYKSLGRFVRQKRISMGYNSAEKFATANTGLVTASYVKHIEAGDGMFGSPETFTGLARALGVTPGLLMDILVDFRDLDGNILQIGNIITLPDNFTMEDKQLIADLISFIGYRKQINIQSTSPIPERRFKENPVTDAGIEAKMKVHRARSKARKKAPQEEKSTPPDTETEK